MPIKPTEVLIKSADEENIPAGSALKGLKAPGFLYSQTAIHTLSPDAASTSGPQTVLASVIFFDPRPSKLVVELQGRQP